MQLKTDQDIIYPYTYDSSNLKGFADFLSIPSTLEEFCYVVKYCYDSNILITVSGAGTGITGARVPLGGAVISLEKFKHIEIDLNSETVKVGAAVTLKELDEFLENYGYFLPPNPTEYNASLGGNAATNASGARTFKYGSIRNFILYINIVLANGEILNINRGQNYAQGFNVKLITENNSIFEFELPNYDMPNVKNASGYYCKQDMDLIDLFIGSEGTLGIFTELKLKIFKRQENLIGCLIYFDSQENLLAFVNDLRSKSLIRNSLNIFENNNITSRIIEYFDKQSLNLIKPKYPEIPEIAVGAIWIEQEFNPEFEDKLINDWYEFISNYTNLVDDTWFAMNAKDHEKLKEFRHELPLQVYENLTNNSQKKVGLDTAVPVEHFDELFKYYNLECPKLNLDYVIFGHIGNCHLHVNVFCKNDFEYQKAREFYDRSIDLALKFKGTVSAEHGIGKLKNSHLVKMYGKEVINKMISVKRILDDKLILNIGTMFDIQNHK